MRLRPRGELRRRGHVVGVGAERVERGERRRVGRHRLQPRRRRIVGARELRADELDVAQAARGELAPHRERERHVVAGRQDFPVRGIGLVHDAGRRDLDAVLVAHRPDVLGDRARVPIGVALIVARGCQQQLGHPVRERLRDDAPCQVVVAQHLGLARRVPQPDDPRVELVVEQPVDRGPALVAEQAVGVVVLEAEAEALEALLRRAADGQRRGPPGQILGPRRGLGRRALLAPRSRAARRRRARRKRARRCKAWSS